MLASITDSDERWTKYGIVHLGQSTSLICLTGLRDASPHPAPDYRSGSICASLEG